MNSLALPARLVFPRGFSENARRRALELFPAHRQLREIARMFGAPFRPPFVKPFAASDGVAFSPLTLSPFLWVKGDVGMTLSTASFAGTGTITQSGTTVTTGTNVARDQMIVGDSLLSASISGVILAKIDASHVTLSTSATVAVGEAFSIVPQAGVSDRITTWSDQSGNGNDLSQTSGLNSPYKPNATINGLPYAYFLGEVRYLARTFTKSQAVTAFAVASWNDFNTNRGIFDGSEVNTFQFRATSGSKLQMYAGAGPLGTTASLTAGQITIVVAIFNGNSSALYLSGGTATTGAAGTNGFTKLKVGILGTGTAGSLNGNLCELLLYSGAMSVANINQVGTYLTRWGATWSTAS